MARARFLVRRRRSRHCTAGVPGSAAPRRNSRVMTRTASDNSVLSLGSCIRAAVTVLSSRTVAAGDWPPEIKKPAWLRPKKTDLVPGKGQFR
jgi:hypothetical protein